MRVSGGWSWALPFLMPYLCSSSCEKEKPWPTSDCHPAVNKTFAQTAQTAQTAGGGHSQIAHPCYASVLLIGCNLEGTGRSKRLPSFNQGRGLCRASTRATLA